MTTSPNHPISTAVDVVAAENEVVKLERHLRRGLKAFARLGVLPAGDGPLLEITPDGSSLQFASIPRERLLMFIFSLEYLADELGAQVPASMSSEQFELDLRPLLADDGYDPHIHWMAS